PVSRESKNLNLSILNSTYFWSRIFRNCAPNISQLWVRPRFLLRNSRPRGSVRRWPHLGRSLAASLLDPQTFPVPVPSRLVRRSYTRDRCHGLTRHPRQSSQFLDRQKFLGAAHRGLALW